MKPDVGGLYRLEFFWNNSLDHPCIVQIDSIQLLKEPIRGEDHSEVIFCRVLARDDQYTRKRPDDGLADIHRWTTTQWNKIKTEKITLVDLSLYISFSYTSTKFRNILKGGKL